MSFKTFDKVQLEVLYHCLVTNDLTEGYNQWIASELAEEVKQQYILETGESP